MAESIKSLYKPTNPKKYTGNPRNIICRSSWERRFCNWCDINESIIEWGSEEFWIPYRAPGGKTRRYFPDFIIKVKESTGQIKTYVIEVKPKKQCSPPPTQPKRKTKRWFNEVKTWGINEAKWKYATEWCDKNDMEFKILNEDHLGIKYKKGGPAI